VSVERRRCRGRRDVGHAGARARDRAACADRRVFGLGGGAGDHGRRPDQGSAARLETGADDVDVVELNEAFAAQVLPVCRELGIDPFGEKLNPHGGAIALGHPYGMTGARIMNTLLNDLATLDETIGLETMCVGGGQGMAMIVERIG
jgi:acetyl-CoA acetyltransferase